jgi:hypothetical protein
VATPLARRTIARGVDGSVASGCDCPAMASNLSWLGRRSSLIIHRRA